MHILATEIQSEDGAANAAVAEAGERLAEQHMRIKRLEEAGDALANNHNPFTFIDWNKAKEAKP
jgi:uncharacterized protein (UPF0212 family)